MKKTYASPELEFVMFNDTDIITVSGCSTPGPGSDGYYEGSNGYADLDCDFGLNCD